MPGRAHEETTSFWVLDIQNALARLTQTPLLRAPGIKMLGKRTFQLGPTHKEADDGIRSEASDYPGVVLEVGVSENMGQLKVDAKRWLEHIPEVQLVILVKISKPKPQVHPTRPTIVVETWRGLAPARTLRSAATRQRYRR